MLRRTDLPLIVLGKFERGIRCFMQMGGTALRMPSADLEHDFGSVSELRVGIQRSMQAQALILGQLVACGRLHEVEKRLARWLLMLQDRVETDVILITQAFLAEMLGSRRAIVTLAAGALQRIGLIEYQRRRVHILDRERLENAGWDCYPVIRKLSMQSAAVPATSLVATASHQSAQSHGDFV